MEILVLIVLTFLNGFFALSELSIISVKKSRMDQRAKQGNTNAQTVLNLLKRPEDFLSAIQVGITLIGIISGAYGGAALSDDVRLWMQDVSFLAPYADTLSLVLVIGLITYFTIVIGELIPKTIALGNADKIALAVAPVISIFTRITMPLVKLLGGSTNLVVRLLGIKQPTEEKLSEEEIRQILKTAGKQGVLAQEESELHQNIFAYSDQRAKDLMTRRMDVEWIDVNEQAEEVLEKLKSSAHSKFPVSDGNIDKLVGVLHSKHFYEYFYSDRSKHWSSIIQKPIYVPETMLAHAVLGNFKKLKQYMGIVLDEFGSMEGIITLHDILEAIVGDLPDIDETHDPMIVKREDGSLLITGAVTIHDLNRHLRHEFISKGDSYATLAGFIIHFLERFPTVGEKFEFNNYTFEVVDMDGVKIDKIILTKLPPSESIL